MPGVSRRRTEELVPNWSVDIGDYVTAMTWSPYGEFLAAAAANGPIQLLDSVSGASLHQLSGHGFGTLDLTWSPDGTCLASAGQDGTTRLWDAVRGVEVSVLEGGADWVEHVAWSPRGDLIATAAGKHLKLWHPDGTLYHHLKPHPSTIAGLTWNADGTRLASICYGGIWLWSPGQEEPEDGLACQDSLISMAWSPNGRYMASGTQGAAVQVWNLKTDQNSELSGYPTKVRVVAWDAKSRYLATGGATDLALWKFSPTKLAQDAPIVLEGHERVIVALAFQGQGSRLASGGEDGEVYVWQPTRRQPLGHGRHRASISQIAWHPQGQWLVSGDAEGQLTTWRNAVCS